MELKEKGISIKAVHLERKGIVFSKKYKPLDSRLKFNYSIVSGSGEGNDPFKLVFVLENVSDSDYNGVIRFELTIPKSNGKIFMPAFMYNRNGGDRGQYSSKACYPHLTENGKKLPFSNWWQVRSDRLSHPVALAYADNCIFGISSSPYYGEKNGKTVFWENDVNTDFKGYNGFYCCVKNGTSVGFTLGYENAPANYILTPDYDKRTSLKNNVFKIPVRSKVEFPIYIYCYEAEREYDIHRAVENCYYRYHQIPRKTVSLQCAVKDIAQAIYTDTYVPEKKNYATVVRMKKGEIQQETGNISIGWTGGAEIATPLLMAGIRLQNESFRLQALECIENIVKNSINPKSGLPFDAYNAKNEWTEKGWWYGHLKIKGHSSYVLGQAVFYILKAYEYENAFMGVSHKEWLDFSEKVLEKFMAAQNSAGAFPYIFSVEDGSGIEYDGYAGCWCYAAMAYYTKITGDKKFFSAMQSANAYYYKFVNKMECYGTPTDTFIAVDSEGVLAFIKASRIMHQLTKSEEYLIQLKRAFDYEFTFKFAYNSPIQVPPLSKIGWSSSGGTVTSICNPHIHPMSNNVVDDMIYYIEQKEDAYVQSRLYDTVLWGAQTYNSFDGEMDFGLKGWMTERFCHSEGLLIEKYPNGTKSSAWFAFLPWGASNVLEGMCGELWGNYHQYFSDEN